jgi:hypothetical protein
MIDLHEGILQEFADAHCKGRYRFETELPLDNRLARQFRFKHSHPGHSNRYRRQLDEELRAKRRAPDAYWAEIEQRARNLRQCHEECA